MLAVNELSKSYDQEAMSLKDISMEIEKGEITVIIGPSGAGKTTLLRSLNQLIKDDQGEILIDGLDVRTLNRSKMRQMRRKIGMVFQNYNLIEPLTVLENVLHGTLGGKPTLLGILSIYSDKEQQEALALIKEMGLEEFAFKQCKDLSGGQKQRVGIARALMQHPQIILCDEPVASLDPKSATLVMDILRALAIEKEMTIVVTLHQVELAKEYADHIIGLRAGSVVFDGPSSALDVAAIRTIYD